MFSKIIFADSHLRSGVKLILGCCLSACIGNGTDVDVFGNEATFPKEFTEMIPMRDGIRLATDVVLPGRFVVGVTPQVPAIVTRTPYGKNISGLSMAWATKIGIAAIVQDTRGRNDSEGEDRVFQDDAFGTLQDGYDTIEWIASQPWSNGKICTNGASALGITQTLMAPTNPPHLVCQVIYVAPANMGEHAMYQGGVFREEMVTFWLDLQDAKEAWLPVLREHDTYDQRAKTVDALSRIEKVQVPALFVGSWFDIFSEGTLAAFRGWQHDAGDGARGKQKLIMGSEDHVGTALASMDVKVDSTYTTEEVARRWLTHHLLGEENGVTEDASVRYFVMEGGQFNGHWESAADWPPPTTTWTLPLNAGPGLGSFAGSVTSLSFVHDPDHPIPTNGGRNLIVKSGAFDQVTLATNYDASRLLFLSEPLTGEVTVAGEVRADLRAIIDGTDAHWMVQLLDITPDGRHLLVTEGSLRAQIRKGRDRKDPVTPGAEDDYPVSVYSTAWKFLPGHRIGLSVAGSNSPRLELFPERRTQTVLVNGPSKLMLPVLTR